LVQCSDGSQPLSLKCSLSFDPLSIEGILGSIGRAPRLAGGRTDSHWVIIGLDKDLNAAMALCARNAIKFLAAQAKISELDAYALCSVAVSFRVTQVVDIVRGVHALIPKSIFAPDLRREMGVV
jgi:acetamidase/formamidase